MLLLVLSSLNEQLLLQRSSPMQASSYFPEDDVSIGVETLEY